MNTAYIHLWNKRVGAVLWDPERQLASFEFEADFIENRWDIAPLQLPIEQAGRIFSFPELRASNTFKGMPGLLADVLPDKYGNSLINAWLLSNGRPADSMNPVEMLCFIGNRGMGALEFEPAHLPGTNTATRVEIAGLVEIASKILNNRQEFLTNLKRDEEKALLDILKIGTSAGGARAKALIAYNEQTGEIRSGQAGAPKGFTQWLIKFDGVHDSQFGATYGFGRVEMAYHFMAAACGIEMTECRLLEENGRAHFMTKRFDRISDNNKVHIQSWCAISHYDFQDVGVYSYEQLFQTMRILGLPYPQAEQLFRRMAFNVMARNCDDHTKNFAFIMDKHGNWQLSPAFDVCYAYRPDSIWVSMQSLRVNGKRDHILRDDFLEIAKQMNIKRADDIINQVRDTVGKWNEFSDKTGVREDLKNAIGKTLLLL